MLTKIVHRLAAKLKVASLSRVVSSDHLDAIAAGRTGDEDQASAAAPAAPREPPPMLDLRRLFGRLRWRRDDPTIRHARARPLSAWRRGGAQFSSACR